MPDKSAKRVFAKEMALGENAIRFPTIRQGRMRTAPGSKTSRAYPLLALPTGAQEEPLLHSHLLPTWPIGAGTRESVVKHDGRPSKRHPALFCLSMIFSERPVVLLDHALDRITFPREGVRALAAQLLFVAQQLSESQILDAKVLDTHSTTCRSTCSSC